MPGLRQVVEAIADHMLNEKAFFNAYIGEFDMEIRNVWPYEKLVVDIDSFAALMIGSPKKSNEFVGTGFLKQETFSFDVIGYITHDDTLVSALAAMALGDAIERFFEQREKFRLTIGDTPFILTWPATDCPVSTIDVEIEAMSGPNHATQFVRTCTCGVKYITDSTMGFPGDLPQVPG